MYDCRNVPLPPYAHTMIPPPVDFDGSIDIKSEDDIEKMRKSCRLVGKVNSTKYT